MNASVETAKPAQELGAPTFGSRLRSYVSGRRGLVILALALVLAGITLSWSWLVAVGVAPLLLALAPCAAMCALGLCMNRKGAKSCSTQSSTASDTSEPPPAPEGRAQRDASPANS